MASNTITYNLEITNNNQVTPLYYTNTITPVGKIERDFYDLVSGDGYYDVSVAKLGTLQTVFAYSTDANLMFFTGASSFSFRIGGQFMWEVPESLGSGIIRCRVSTSASTAVDVNLMLIGI
jgi:hypothetical protein